MYHNSQDPFYRFPQGATEVESELIIRIKVSKKYSGRVMFHYWMESTGNVEMAMNIDLSESEKLEKDTVYFVKVDTGPKGQLLWYNFLLEDAGIFYGNQPDGLGGEGQSYPKKPLSYQVTIYQPFTVPEWYKESIVYHIFPDRFFRNENANPLECKRSNRLIHCRWDDKPHYFRNEEGEIIYWDFFGGNLEGVMDKLDYLKELGISTIYFNPIFEARSNHRYDTGDYHKIDPMLGSNEFFKSMIKTLKGEGINVILDGVFSHTGADSIYFNKYEYYDSVGAYNSHDSKYYDWYIFGKYPEKYESWWGVKDLPNVDELDPTYRDFIYNDKDSVVRSWLETGIAGWRLDVVDELPQQFLKELREAVKETNQEAVIVGEVWEDASNKVSYGRSREYLLGGELDVATNYPLREALINFIKGSTNSRQLHRKIMSLYENYPKDSFFAAFNVLGSHDVERILTTIGKNHLLSAVFFQMAFPGVPVIYYGDEAGLEGAKDPDNRRTYPWGNEDQEILKTHKKAIKMRKENDVFVNGDFTSGYCGKHVYYFTRKNKNTYVLCLYNNSRGKESYEVPLEDYVDAFINFVDEKKYPVKGHVMKGYLEPGEIKVLCKKKQEIYLVENPES